VTVTVFRGAVAIVTGGASGFGRGLAMELARRGARVVVADVDLAGARETAEAIAAAGGEAEAGGLDVTDEVAFRSLVEDVASRHGRLDVLVNNAGLGVEGEVAAIPLAHWERIFAVNFWGVLHGTRAAWAVMLRQGSGHIVNVASLAELTPMPLGAPYAATKYAVVGLTASVKLEGRDPGIRATAVCPGFITSRVFENALYTDVSKDELLALNPFRFLSADDAARRALDGVAKNRAVVVFPWYARLISVLWRLAPALVTSLLLKSLRDLRRTRAHPGQ
jgi:NAD(P)-dependent dehydrogenase (short-subunit alcohol dehydrogenase family)